MAYTHENFRTKKALKEAVKAGKEVKLCIEFIKKLINNTCIDDHFLEVRGIESGAPVSIRSPQSQ